MYPWQPRRRRWSRRTVEAPRSSPRWEAPARCCLTKALAVSPAFAFNSFEELGRFVAWLLCVQTEIKKAAERTTRFGKLIDTQICIEGNHLYLILVFTTGDAAGQNMASIATEAAVTWILANTPVAPRAAYVEANFSGDKRASAQSLQTVRGKKVTAEVTIPADLVQRRLHTTVGRMIDFAGFATIGGIMSGTLGTQGHYANGLAAMFIACGQDAACVAEAAVGNTRIEATSAGRALCLGHAAQFDHGKRRWRDKTSQPTGLPRYYGIGRAGPRARTGGGSGGFVPGGRDLDRGRDLRWGIHPCARSLGARDQRKKSRAMKPRNQDLSFGSRWRIYFKERFPSAPTRSGYGGIGAWARSLIACG